MRLELSEHGLDAESDIVDIAPTCTQDQDYARSYELDAYDSPGGQCHNVALPCLETKWDRIFVPMSRMP